MTTTLQVNEALKAALEDLANARKLWEQEVEHKEEWFDSCAESLSRMINSSNNNNGHNGHNENGDIFAKHVVEQKSEPQKRVLSVGDDKVALVRNYLQEHGRVRQAQIAKDLGINSGSVSVALQVLRIAGEVSAQPYKVDGSRVWEPVSVPAAV